MTRRGSRLLGVGLLLMGLLFGGATVGAFGGGGAALLAEGTSPPTGG